VQHPSNVEKHDEHALRFFHCEDCCLVSGSHPWTQLSSPVMKLQLKVCRFDKSGGDPAGIAERPWYASRTGLPAVTTVLESVC
jgi:hypothetical protein